MNDLPPAAIGHPTELAHLADASARADRLQRVARAGSPKEKAAVRAAQDLESVFLYRLLQEMKDTIPDGGLLGDGASEQIEDLFWHHLAQGLARSGGLGLWREIYRQTAGAAAAGEAKPTMEQLR